MFAVRCSRTGAVRAGTNVPSKHPKTPRFPTNRREIEEFDGRKGFSDSKTKLAYLVRGKRYLVDGVGIFVWLEVEGRKCCVKVILPKID